MEKFVFDNKDLMGAEAAEAVKNCINGAIEKKGQANIILATGASQFEMLENLVKKIIDWSKVVMFHLDEYIGMDITHPASFRKYLTERFLDKIDPLKEVYLVDGSNPDAEAECDRLDRIIKAHPIDVACVGIGENGHLAFNDPPADFETEKAYIVVDLDSDCRKQQMGEGWFATIDDVPTQAISMSVNQIMDSNSIIVSCPDQRKAKAVKNTLTQEISPMYPASVLRNHQDCRLFLDSQSASLI